MNQREQDKFYMAEALREAKKGREQGEVPVGAVIVHDGTVIAVGHNLRETSQDPTAHAEILAIRSASASLESWRLCGCTLYVTLEPCVMCMGAIILARIPRLVYGCHDPRAGAVGSIYNLAEDRRFNHRVEVTEGILEEICSGMLSEFFFSLRNRKKTDS